MEKKRKQAIIDDAIKRIRSMEGIIDVRVLDPQLKKEIRKLETQAEKTGACGGLMPFTNKGVWDSLQREVTLVLILGSINNIIDDDGIVYILDQKGQLIGEYLNERRRKTIKEEMPDAYFLSEDFVLYPGMEIEGEPYFVLGALPFPELEKVDGVKDVTSGSISTLCDDMIKSITGYDRVKAWTHLVGFNLENGKKASRDSS